MLPKDIVQYPDPMTNSKNAITVKRAFGEFLIIVVGVLTALAADEWRQNFDREKLERELLEDVRKEFAANLNEIESTTKSLEEIRTRHTNITELTPDEFADLSKDSAIELANEAMIPRPMLDARTGVLRSVIDGGQLATISDRHLRYAIAEWPTWLEFAEAMEVQELKYFREAWIPILGTVLAPEVDPREHADSFVRGASSQLWFVDGYLKSLDQLRDKTELVLSQIDDFDEDD